MSVICFHNPDEENGYLSNWTLTPFVLGNIQFSSVEQYMMYQKAMTFKDTGSAKRILETNDVTIIKKLGRQVSNYDDVYWNGVRQIIVFQGLMAKFTQNTSLAEELLNTGDAVIAECAVKDRIWGIGLSMNDPDRNVESRWKGKNLLGFTLMMVRQTLKSASTN